MAGQAERDQGAIGGACIGNIDDIGSGAVLAGRCVRALGTVKTAVAADTSQTAVTAIVGRLDCAIGAAAVSIHQVAVIAVLEGQLDPITTDRRACGDVGEVVAGETLGAASGGSACVAVGNGRTVYIHDAGTCPIIEDIAVDAGGAGSSRWAYQTVGEAGETGVAPVQVTAIEAAEAEGGRCRTGLTAVAAGFGHGIAGAIIVVPYHRIASVCPCIQHSEV